MGGAPSSFTYFAYEDAENSARALGGEQWTLFPDEVSNALHVAMKQNTKKQKIIKFDMGGTEYRFDVMAMTQRIRTSQRKIQRLMPRRVYALETEDGGWQPFEEPTQTDLARAQEAGLREVELRVYGADLYKFNLAAMNYKVLLQYDDEGDVIPGDPNQTTRFRVLPQCALFAFEDGEPGSEFWKLCDGRTCWLLHEARLKKERIVLHSTDTYDYVFDLKTFIMTATKQQTRRRVMFAGEQPKAAVGISRRLKVVSEGCRALAKKKVAAAGKGRKGLSSEDMEELAENQEAIGGMLDSLFGGKIAHAGNEGTEQKIVWSEDHMLRQPNQGSNPDWKYSDDAVHNRLGDLDEYERMLRDRTTRKRGGVASSDPKSPLWDEELLLDA